MMLMMLETSVSLLHLNMSRKNRCGTFLNLMLLCRSLPKNMLFIDCIKFCPPIFAYTNEYEFQEQLSLSAISSGIRNLLGKTLQSLISIFLTFKPWHDQSQCHFRGLLKVVKRVSTFLALVRAIDGPLIVPTYICCHFFLNWAGRVVIGKNQWEICLVLYYSRIYWNKRHRGHYIALL